ncbi:CotO family spore coat protein [Bacillus mycoides]|uniref:CotO family spore coat protein n=1 Tax=Bacillus mycoides TaxID=1405 RepID=UPI001C01D2D9|nr:CotO family spore coat protein [Bacillus mycoides]
MEVGGMSVENKNKGSTVGKPLLYITQVNLELDTLKIKRILLTNFENDNRQEQGDREQSSISSAVEEMVIQKEVEKVVEQKEIVNKEKQEEVEQIEVGEQRKQVTTVPHNKAFKDMNNEEKIHFLLNRPHYIPKVRCRIKTATVSYVGSIISYRNGVVSIMPPNSMRDIRVSIEEIKSIDMAVF